MAPTTARLVLRGTAGDLSFRDGSGAKRRALPGVPFEVDADTAAILLGDPNVSPFVEPRSVSSRNDPEAPAAAPAGLELSYDELKARAKALGLTPPRKKDELVAAIAAEEARLADEAAAADAASQASGSGESNQEGGSQPGDDPDAVASGESGTPPAMPDGSSTGGAIVLGDLPPGARVGD